MKECELCNSPARMFCESDQASLCWECDSKVHSANFLVARHPRNLLCHVCQTKTPWQASGSRLGPTVTVCERCVKRRDDNGFNQDADESRNDDDDDDEEEEEEEEEEEDEEHDEEEDQEDESDDDGGGDDDEESGDTENNDEDGDNQVVPWSSSNDNPPPGTSSSSSEESSSKFRNNISLKRTRDDDNLEDDDVDRCGRRSRTVDSIRPCHDRKRRSISIKRLAERLISRDLFNNQARSK